MSIPEPAKRTFTITDNSVLQYAKTLRSIFMGDQATFVARDADFANPYEVNWETAITQADSYPTDEQITDIMTQKTADVEEAMVNCRNKWMDTKPFVKKTFPDKVVVWNEFGFNDYQNIDHNQEGMVKFFKLLYETAQKYAVQLNAKNYTAAMITEIQTLGKALDDANNAQEFYKKDTPGITQERIEKHNLVYKFCQTVCETGKLIFRNNYAKYQQYLLPASEEPAASFMLSGKITDQASSLALANVTVTVQPLNVSTQTDSNGKYGFGILAAGTYTLEISLAGYTPKTIPGIAITAGTTTTKNIQLEPAAATGTVSGMVKQTGMPVKGASISADGFPLLMATTDINGNYTINNVPAGMQNITAKLPPPSIMPPQTQSVNVMAGAEVNASFNF